jgi:hypothetical protein
MKKFMFAAFLALAVVALVAPQPVIAADDEKPFTIHGEVRWRSEYSNNTADFNDNGANDDQAMFFPYRVRIAAEGHFTKNVHAWIEFQNTGVSGDDVPRHEGDFSSDTKLYQGNVTFDQLWSKNFSLRLGRQEIVAGNGLLLGNEEFYGGISHDGAVANWKLKKVNLMLWYTRPNEGSVSGFAIDRTPDQVNFFNNANTQNFLGGYATWTWKKDQNFDVYLMDLRQRGITAVTPTTIDTLGARYAHDTTTKNGFIWNLEYAKQLGKISKTATSAVADADFDGHAIEGWFGFNWKMGKNVHRVYGRYEQASGDKTNTTDKIESFQPMFGDFHNRLGRGDWFALQDASTGLGSGGVGVTTGGIQATSIGYNGFYNDKHELGVAFWKYKTDQDVAIGGGNTENDLGSAIDFWYGFNYSRNTNFVVSVSQLKPGDLLKAVGPTVGKDDSVQRVYAQMRLRF